MDNGIVGLGAHLSMYVCDPGLDGLDSSVPKCSVWVTVVLHKIKQNKIGRLQSTLGFPVAAVRAWALPRILEHSP